LNVSQQKLQRDIVWSITLVPDEFPCAVAAFRQSIIINDPFLNVTSKQPPHFLARSYNYKEMRVCLYAVNAINGDFKKWKAELKRPSSRLEKEKGDSVEYLGFGRKVFDSILPVTKFIPNQEVDFIVDLSPALNNEVGQVLVVVVPSSKAHYPVWILISFFLN